MGHIVDVAGGYKAHIMGISLLFKGSEHRGSLITCRIYIRAVIIGIFSELRCTPGLIVLKFLRIIEQ